MHAVRILRRQNLLPPAPQRICGGAAAPGCDLQRPAEMFSRVLQSDAQAVMAADFVVEEAHIRELFGEVRCSLHLSGFEPAADLPRQPGLALRAAPDHHGVGPRHFQRLDRLLE